MRKQGAPLWFLLLACTGCGVSDAPPRGFGSRQILAIRDPQLDLGDFTEDESKVYLGRYVRLRPALGVPPPHDLSTLDLATAQRELVAPGVVVTTQLTGESGQGRSLALLHYPAEAGVPPDFASRWPGHLQLSFVNEANGRHLDISDVADRNLITFGASESDPIVIDRFDAVDNVQVWFGPPEALEAAPASLARIIGFDATGAFGLMKLPGFEPDIRHIAFGGGDGSVVVTAEVGEYVVIPDELGTAIAPGPMLGGPHNPLYWCVPAASPEAPPRCFFVYSRNTPNSGPSRLFARASDDPRELVLPGGLENPGTLENLDRFQNTTTLLWTADGPSGNHLYSWNLGADRVGGCDVPVGLARGSVWTGAQDRFAVQVYPTDSEGLRLPGVLVLGVPGGTCRVITPEGRYYLFWTFSPDGTVLDWHEHLAGGGTAIHLTATDDSGERRIDLPGTIYTSEFYGDQRLLLRRSSADGTGLSFIDLAEDPIRDHVVADRLATSWVWIDDHWLLLGDAHSSQDDTFTLRAVNIDTGASRLVSTSVVGFATPWTVRPAGATVLPVAYLVRGRAASAQDGIWSARLPLADFLSDL
jgi:hypothetical protein